ncbi:hypothetical protein JCM11251_004285 [Rhodosporidiobolus azoricus]
MTATRTVTKARLVYSLPSRCPIPFSKHPSYPIRAPSRDLPQAYSDALWPPAESKQSEQLILDSFARLLLALLGERPPEGLNTLVRALLLPLQDFDKRWRDSLPNLVEPREEDEDFPAAPIASSSGISAAERAKLHGDYERWAVLEKAKLEEEKKTRKGKMTKGKGKEKAPDQDGAAMEQDGKEEEEDEVRVRAGDWLAAKELLETRLQALLLLTLLSLPASFQPPLPKKGKKKKNPERYPDTLDPSMLLDFLTDRMQIWRVMKDVADLDVIGNGDTQEAEKQEKVKVMEERDAVQVWWQDIVEPLFRTHVDASVLSHHRLKLFPAPSQADRVAQRLAPAPSPFKARSLLSLERSARRREQQEGQKMVVESPTMKRLMSMPSLGWGGEKGKEGQPGNIFKVPSLPTKRKDSLDSSAAVATDETATASTTSISKDPSSSSSSRRLPRKQERPRPLPRGDSSTAGAKDVLKRREVSVIKRKPAAAAAGLGLKKSAGAVLGGSGEKKEEEGRKRKRKSISPKKLTASDRAALPTLTLVPDTPSKPTSKSSSSTRQPSGRAPFSRATSLPSFAALGAAFRAGVALPAGSAGLALPVVAEQPTRRPGGRSQTQDPMEWDGRDGGGGGVGSDDGADDGDAEDAWLDGREDEWRRKGGRERQSSYNGDEEGEDASMGEAGAVTTPKKKGGQVLLSANKLLLASAPILHGRSLAVVSRRVLSASLEPLYLLFFPGLFASSRFVQPPSHVNMALQEVTNTLNRTACGDSSSLNSAHSTDASPSSSIVSTTTTTSRVLDKHPWAEGKKVLKPVEEGEKMRSLRVRYLCTADLIEANDRLREELIQVYAQRDEQLALLDGLRQSHTVVCGQLEATRNELGSQEDELFVLREMHEGHAKEVGELRKAKEFAEVERSMVVQAKADLETQHAAQTVELRGEVEGLRKQLKAAEEELEEARHSQIAQQEACRELLEEQKKLEEAYDEAVAQLDVWKGQQGAGANGQGVSDPLADVSLDWEKVELDDASATPPRKGKSTIRKGPTKFLIKRRRTPSQPLLFNSSTAAQGDVQLVKNDVEQLKQTIALLISERGVSFDEQRSSYDGGQL